MKKIVLLIACFVASVAYAQDYSKYIFNVGGGVGIPVGSTSNYTKVNGNAVVGGGYNFSRIVGMTAEFMWHGLPPSTGLKNRYPNTNLNASSNLYSVTGNFIFRVPTQGKFGFYGIGGGGWYHRNWSLNETVLVPGTVCTGYTYWFGVSCVNGLVETNATVRSGSTNGGGMNVGAGLTFGRAAGAKFYTEARYHVAWFNHTNTHVLPVTFGVRW